MNAPGPAAPDPAISAIPAKSWVAAAAIRLAAFFGVWMILTQGRLSDLAFVVPLLAATAAISLWSVPPRQWRIRPSGVLRFAPWFLWAAIRGGVDVARRVFPARMPIDPAYVTVAIDASANQRLLLALTVSLLPGTATCRISDDRLLVHCLDQNQAVEAEIQDLSARIRRLVD
jgi:multicomponent Na+:H+ antiporter subunit E